MFPEWNIFSTLSNGPLGPVSYYQFTYLRAMRLDFMGLAPPVCFLYLCAESYYYSLQ
jgi:hypothetical protein